MTDDQDKWVDARAFGRPMAAEDFRDWRRRVAKLYPEKSGEDGLMYERDAAELLGISRGGLRACERKGAPLYIALACTAILADLRPYKKGMRKLSDKDTE